jgi:hypothetical protein
MLESDGGSSDGDQDGVVGGLSNRDLWIQQLAMSKDSVAQEREDGKKFVSMKAHQAGEQSFFGERAKQANGERQI